MTAGRRRDPDLSQHFFGELRRRGEPLELRQLDQQLALAFCHGEALGAFREMECAGRAQKAGGPELDFLRGQMGLQSLVVHVLLLRVAVIPGFTFHHSLAPSRYTRNSLRARWIYVFTVPSGRSSIFAISS